MNRVVFLLEEYSMKVFLDGFLPRLFPELPFLCVPHEGKQDLEKSIPRKLRAWREPGVRFVVLRDNDNTDCRELKSKLQELCEQGRRTDSLVRIACQELEAWYLGDPEALASAYDRDDLKTIAQKARYRDPDTVVRPSQALKEIIPEYQKVVGARRLAPLIDRERNRSRSFRVLLEGLDGLVRNFSQYEFMFATQSEGENG